MQSQLSIASDKVRGIIGKADLDLAQFEYDDFNVIRLEIKECQYEGAWIEVGLKGEFGVKTTSTRNKLNMSTRSVTTTDVNQVDGPVSKERY